MFELSFAGGVLAPSPASSTNICSSSFVASQSRCFSVDIDRRDDKPEAYHLDHVKTRISETIPMMFRQRLDYTFYRKDVVLENQIINVKRVGRDALMKHLGFIAFTGCFFLPHIHSECISALPVLEDGTVRVRWRIHYVSFYRLIVDPKLFRFDYRMKNLSWYDGVSVLSVDGNGEVHHVTIQKTQRDEESVLVNRTKKIAANLGVLPGANTNFQKLPVRSENEERKSCD